MNAARRVIEHAPAKLNLALHVRRRRDDGYHEIETLFAFCRDGDVVTMAEAEADRFDITGPFAGDLDAPADGAWRDNLVTRAVDRFRRALGGDASYRIELHKALPVASGIGGGSADAAATLRALAQLHDVAHDDTRLTTIARELGADVPACLAGRAAYGTGRGDDLRPVSGFADTPVLLVNPGVGVSTAAVFAGWDGIDRGPLDPADPSGARNDLEPPARALAPAIDDVLAALSQRHGVTLARMSGSGATCFALFETAAARDAAAAALARPGWWLLPSRLA